MERSEEIFSLFEGQCPADGCGAPIIARRAGGTKQFYIMNSWADELPVTDRWDESVERDAGDPIGTVYFECAIEEEHEFQVDFGQWGEWM